LVGWVSGILKRLEPIEETEDLVGKALVVGGGAATSVVTEAASVSGGGTTAAGASRGRAVVTRPTGRP
jgi:hypothetical protein